MNQSPCSVCFIVLPESLVNAAIVPNLIPFPVFLFGEFVPLTLILMAIFKLNLFFLYYFYPFSLFFIDNWLELLVIEIGQSLPNETPVFWTSYPNKNRQQFHTSKSRLALFSPQKFWLISFHNTYPLLSQFKRI